MVCLIVCILIFRSLVFKPCSFCCCCALFVFGGLHFDLVLGLTRAFNLLVLSLRRVLCKSRLILFRINGPNDIVLNNKIITQPETRTLQSKSAVTKPISGCVRIACSSLMITSLLQVCLRLHAGLMQVVSLTSSKSANIKLQQV